MPTASPSAARYPRAILATGLIPWCKNNECDEALFRETIRHVLKELTTHVYIFGTAGEGHAVSDRLFQEITRTFADEMRRANATPMVGIISLSLATVIERVAWAQDQGIDEFQISLPAWAPLNDAEVDRFFAETCGRFPRAHFLHYNLARTGRLLTGADYARLAPRHPNLVAIKMGGTDLPALTAIAEAAPTVRCFFTEFAYIALRERVDCGLLCALGACAPHLARQLFSADTPEQRRALEPGFRTLHAAAREAVAGRAHIDGAYDQMYLKLHYPQFPLRLLPPYATVDEARFRIFEARCQPLLSPTLLP